MYKFFANIVVLVFIINFEDILILYAIKNNLSWTEPVLSEKSLTVFNKDFI